MPKPPSHRSSSREVQSFLNKSKAIRAVVSRQARLLFAIDATASRQPTWDTACQLQGEMFRATAQTASLSIQLCYFRGLGEFYSSHWLSDSQALARQMSAVHCEGGVTQLRRLLKHALKEHQSSPVKALVFIGDAMEENAAELYQLAGDCGLRQLPLFMFQEGHIPQAETCFRQMAKLSGGAFARFDAQSAATLTALLGAVARYAAGGRKALENNGSDSDRLLLRQLKP
jgi:hypothetical protein